MELPLELKLKLKLAGSFTNTVNGNRKMDREKAERTWNDVK